MSIRLSRATAILGGFRAMVARVMSIALGAAVFPACVHAQSVPASTDANSIEAPLTDVPGDVARGRAIVASRQTGLCLLCHTAPIPEQRFQGSLAPNLAGTGARWTEGQLRLRIVDGKRLYPQTMMPSYGTGHAGSVRVAAAWQGKPVLEAQQIEDVVAYLRSLR